MGGERKWGKWVERVEKRRSGWVERLGGVCRAGEWRKWVRKVVRVS